MKKNNYSVIVESSGSIPSNEMLDILNFYIDETKIKLNPRFVKALDDFNKKYMVD